MKKNFDKQDLIKIKNVCFIKDTIKGIKRQVTNQKKILKIYMIQKLVSRIYNSTPIHQAKDLNRHFTKEKIHVSNKHIKICVTSIVRGMKFNSTMRYHHAPFRVSNLKGSVIQMWVRIQNKSSLTHCWWEWRTVQAPCKAVCSVLKSYTYIYHLMQPLDFQVCAHEKCKHTSIPRIFTATLSVII